MATPVKMQGHTRSFSGSMDREADVDGAEGLLVGTWPDSSAASDGSLQIDGTESSAPACRRLASETVEITGPASRRWCRIGLSGGVRCSLRIGGGTV